MRRFCRSVWESAGHKGSGWVQLVGGSGAEFQAGLWRQRRDLHEPTRFASRSQVHLSVCSDAKGLFLGAQHPAGNSTEEHAPQDSCWDPPTNLVHLEISLNKKARNTSHASSRNIPEPSNLCSSGRQLGSTWRREAGGRRGWICVSSVSILASRSFLRRNV